MLVSNDFYKSARRRAIVATNTIDSRAILDRCFYDLVRGPDLRESASSLRGQSILADQYGYGFTGHVGADAADAGDLSDPSNPGDPYPFVYVYINADPTSENGIKRMLAPESTTNFDPSAANTNYVDGIWAGRVFSIVSGQLKGYSGRIVYNEFQTSGTTSQVRLTLLQNGEPWASLLPEDRVVINGRDFSGFGAGEITALVTGGETLLDPDAESMLGMKALLPNLVGDVFDPSGTGTPNSINENQNGYLAADNSPNEAYDAPDFQNMFLSGYDAMGRIIPSFHRDTLYGFHATSANLPPSAISEFSFRPIYQIPAAGVTPAPADNLVSGVTANMDYFNTNFSFAMPDGTLQGTANDASHLDVDTDNDGERDSVWIDINLPESTNSSGRRVKPMVAYRVVDMGGRLDINAHGSYADATKQSWAALVAGGRGAGYGPAEISLAGLFATPLDYRNLLNSRYFEEGGTTPRISPGTESGAFESFSEQQKLFGYPQSNNTNVVGGLFGNGCDLFSQFSVQTLTVDAAGNPVDDTLPEFTLPVNDAASDTQLLTAPEDFVSPYNVNLGGSASGGDSLFTARELEAVLRTNDADANQLPQRLRELLENRPEASDLVSVGNYEIGIPATPLSLVERLNTILSNPPPGSPPGTPAILPLLADRSARIRELIPREVLLGGKVDINRPLGNGLDDDPADGFVDNESLIDVEEQTDQFGPTNASRPFMDLDNNDNREMGDATARQILAKDLYITALLACGQTAPAGLTVSTGTADEAYAKMLAQWAVNIVDFRDLDSNMTRFVYDPTPFDASGWDPGPEVWGAERPELLITETFAYHDRRNEDLRSAGGGTLVEGDDADWDSGQVPQSGAFFELYHPWKTANPFSQALPAELGSGGVELGRTTNTADPADQTNSDPVWRMAFKRDKVDTQFVRAIYFVDIATATRPSLTSDLAAGSDYFYTTLDSKTVAPGEYAVVGSSGNVGLRAGRYETTFGRLQPAVPVTPAMPAPPAATDVEITSTRAIILNAEDDTVIRRTGAGTETPAVDAKVIVINNSSVGTRSLSLSDPDGGYMIPGTSSTASALDGQLIFPPLEHPLDSQPTGLAPEEIEDYKAVWTNGVSDNFRFAYLQRLADPLQDFNATTNPYITVDVAGVDLLAFNGMTMNQVNAHSQPENSTLGEPIAVQTMGETEFRSAERGESFATADAARRSLFASEDGVPITVTAIADQTLGDRHNLSYLFKETFGTLNGPLNGSAAPMGWLAWNNRPYANAAELANVPFVSTEMLTHSFNEGSLSTVALLPELVVEQEVGEYFGKTVPDSSFRHLLRLGQDNGPLNATLESTNRMIRIFEFVDVPSRFLGTETWLPTLTANAGGRMIGDVDYGNVFPRFNPPYHFVPNFRIPGKVNLNAIERPVLGAPSTVWDAIVGGASATVPFNTFIMERDESNPGDPTDVLNYFTTAEGGEFVPNPLMSRKGADTTLFQNTEPESTTAANGRFAADTPGAPKDTQGSAYFQNEFRQKLEAVATTRSSTFAIWITVGYFEVDELGRIGQEVDSDIGEQERNRAFFMIDRSIPAAFEPGANHNVDDIVLTRSYIE